MKTAPILSNPTAAPTGAEAACPAPGDLLLLFIVRMLIRWAQGLVTTLRQRTETTDLTDITRAFGTTDIALIVARLTSALQRLHALEAKILRTAAGLDTDPQRKPTGAAASRRSPSAPQPLGRKPEDIHFLSLVTLEQIVATSVRATGPP